MAWLAVLGWAALALLALLVLLLLVPVQVRAWGEVREGARGGLRVAWLFGLVDRELALRPGKAPPAKETARARRPFSARALFSTAGFRRALVRLVRRTWRAVRVRAWSLSLRLGSDDPATTGRVAGALFPALAALLVIPRGSLDLQPAWEGPAFAARAEGEARILPARVAAAALAFALTPATWRAFRNARRPA